MDENRNFLDPAVPADPSAPDPFFQGFQQPDMQNPQGAPAGQPGMMNPAMQQPGMMNPAMQQPGMMNRQGFPNQMGQMQTKYCQYCGSVIPAAAVICTNCGCQTGQMQTAPQNIVIQNTNANVNTNVNRMYGGGRPKNKWVAFLLCLFLGYFGVHKFYEGRILGGLIYLFTFGLFGFGWLIDCLILLLKPNPYYV